MCGDGCGKGWRKGGKYDQTHMHLKDLIKITTKSPVSST